MYSVIHVKDNKNCLTLTFRGSIYMPYKNIEDRKKYRQRRDVKDRKNKARRKKYADDPEYRKKILNKMKQRILLGYNIMRLKNDPEKARKAREATKRWREENKEKIKERRKKYVKENIEKVNINKRKWYKNNTEKIRAQQRLWRKNNPEKVREMNRKKCNRRRKADPKYNLNKKMSLLIRQTLKDGKNGRHWEVLVDYTLNNLIKHLKKTMPQSYSWKDFISGDLHIDHKIPISAFNFTKPEHADFKRCWALKNLQLLPAKENLIKSDKLERPFQPTLKLSFRGW